MGKTLKSLAKKLLEEEAIEGGEGGNDRPLDEEYDPLTGLRGSRSTFRSPNARAVDQETIAIDELLSSVPKAQGFYLKLLKEVRPGQFDYKLRIDDWENWTDLQDEVAKIVRGYSADPKFRSRWGSGLYQIIVHKERGMRDTGKYHPIYFHIDAMEPDQNMSLNMQNIAAVNPTETIQTNLNMLTQLLDVVKKGNPTPEDQKAVYEKLADLKVDLAKNDSNNNTNMMNTVVSTLSNMLTAQNNKPIDSRPSALQELATLIAALAPTGALDKLLKPAPNVNPTENLLLVLKQAKEMGLIPDANKKEDMFDMLTKLRGAGLLPDLTARKEVDPIEKTLDMMGKIKPLIELSMGKAQEASPWFKLAEAFGPHAIKLGGEIVGAIRENSKRRFAPVNPNINPNINIIPNSPNPSVEYIPQTFMPPPPPVTPTISTSGVFDDEDERIMQRSEDFIKRRNAQLKVNEPNMPLNGIPLNEQPIDNQSPFDSGPQRSPFDSGPSIDLTNQPKPVNQPINQPIQPNAQEIAIMQVFQQMKIARDRNDPAYFPVLRELILQQAGDEMYDNIVNGSVPMMQLFSQIRYIAGTWIDEPQTYNYFQTFITWAKKQQENEIIAYCSRCDEEIVFVDLNNWNASNKKCMTCQSTLELVQSNETQNNEALDTNQLVNVDTHGTSDVILPGE